MSETEDLFEKIKRHQFIDHHLPIIIDIVNDNRIGNSMLADILLEKTTINDWLLNADKKKLDAISRVIAYNMIDGESDEACAAFVMKKLRSIARDIKVEGETDG